MMLASGKVAVGPAQRPNRSEQCRIPSRLARHAVRGLPSNDSENLTRLESFFAEPDSSTPGYSARRNYRANEFPDDVDVADVRSATTESASTSAQPAATATTQVGEQVEAVTQKLSTLTTEQLANLQAAAHQAAEYISQLEQAAVASVGELKTKLQNSEGTLSSSFQKSAATLGHTVEAQFTHVHDSLSHALEGLKQLQLAPTPATTSTGKKQSAKTSKPSNTKGVAAKAKSSETPVGLRLQQELHDGIASLQQLTTEQLRNLQSAAAAIQSDVVERTQQLTASLKTQADGARAPPSKQSGVTKRQAPSQVAAGGSSPVGARLQQEVHDGLVTLQQLTTQQLTHLQSAAAAIQADIARRSQQISTALQGSTATAGSNSSRGPSESATSVGVRFRQEIQQGIASLQNLTGEQLSHLQTAAKAIQADVSKGAQQLTAAVKSGLTTPTVQKQAVAAPAKQRGAATKQTRGASASETSSTQIAALKNLSARGLENLQVAAQAVQHAVTNLPDKARAVRLPSVSMPSVSMPSPSTFTDVSQMKAAVVSNPWAFAATGAVLILATLRRIRSIRRGPKLSSEEIAAGLAKSRRALDAQRNRLKQALSSGTVDSSVFSAVRKKGASTEQEESDSEDTEDSSEDAAQGNQPEEWDSETRRAWQSFVKSSKLSEGEMWDPLAPVDKGLPQVFVDLDKE